MIPQVAACNAAESNDTSLHTHTLENCFRTKVHECLGDTLTIDLMYIGEHHVGNMVLFIVMVFMLFVAVVLTMLLYAMGKIFRILFEVISDDS
jgi:Trk-type K+ transport system membrane component